MPTGYTALITESDHEISFKEFALECARAFGALVLMRDYPMGAKIPEEFKPSDHHKIEKDKAQLKLEAFLDMSKEEKINLIKNRLIKQIKSNKDSAIQQEKENKKLNEMLKKVNEWEPPSKDHEVLKSFMVNQINLSFSTINYYKYIEDLEESLNKINFESEIDKEIGALKRDINYHDENYQKEVIRTAERNLWIKQLRNSL